MPREKESYRDNLERLMDRFPGKEILLIHRGFPVHRNGLPGADGQRYPA